MIYNMAGGNMPLDFSVEAYDSELLLPATARKNTIAVFTDTPITGWAFDIEAPAAPTAGMVWFYTTASSSVAFNAVRKNEIAVYPAYARQYVNGAWVDKTAKTYQNGEWVDWRVYAYNKGNVYQELTGGWSKSAMTTGSSDPVVPTVVFAAEEMRMSVKGATYATGGIYTEKSIDLTPYKEIHCIIKHPGDYENAYLSVSETVPYNINTDYIVDQTFGVVDTYTGFVLDISSVNQPAYLSFSMVYPGHTLYIKSVWLERK